MAQTIGHSARHGGLRGHSIGSIYPFMVVAMGNPNDGTLRWRVRHPHGHMMNEEHHNATSAYKHAIYLKAGCEV